MAAIPPSLLQMFGPIESLLSDPTVRRVLVDAADVILVERHGRVERTPLAYPPGALDESLDALARRAGKPFDALHPSLEAQLKDGTRFLALRPPAVERGPMLVVVRPGGRLTDLPGLVRQDALSEEAADALAAAMRAGLNIAVVGPADSGRTTLLEALAGALAPGARIVVLEEHAELRLPAREPMRMQTRKADKDGNGAVTTADLLYFAGRMAVDRVVIGDLRWQDASETVNLLSARLSPVLMALPGLNAEDALARLEALARASATGGRDRAVAGLTQSALDLIVTLGRHDGQRVVTVIERVRAGGDRARLEPVFARSAVTGFSLAATPDAAGLVEAWRHAVAPSPALDEDGDRETLGYLPAIPLMTDTHRLPEAAPRPAPAPPAPAGLQAISPAEAPRLSLSPQVTPLRAPMPVPRGATLDATPAPEPVAPAPAAGGDPMATDNMFATLRPGLPGEASDPLRRLLQGLRSDPPAESEPTPAVVERDTGEATMALAPATIEAPVPLQTGELAAMQGADAPPAADPTDDPSDSGDDEEHTVVNDAIPTSTVRDDAESRPGKTFSQVLRNLGVGPGESQEISGAWTGVNIVSGRQTLPATEGADPDAMDRTRETSSPVEGRTTRVHATDD